MSYAKLREIDPDYTKPENATVSQLAEVAEKLQESSSRMERIESRIETIEAHMKSTEVQKSDVVHRRAKKIRMSRRPPTDVETKYLWQHISDVQDKMGCIALECIRKL